MTMAELDPSAPVRVDQQPGRSQASIVDLATTRGCPFLLADGGGWRLGMPSREHRCAAVSPPAALSLEKQARLCLTDDHHACATYLASVSARGIRTGTPVTAGATRWGIARTTTVIEDAGGMRSRMTGLLLDRRRWPAIPAVILVTTLVVLALSGLRGGGVTPVATASPTHPSTSAAPTLPLSTAPNATEAPSSAPSEAPSVAPTTKASAKPGPSKAPPATFRTYSVRSGDTLSGIASRFGTTPRAIADLNGISVGTTLRVGQVLKIPN